MTVKDDNDRLREGTLPADPAEGTIALSKDGTPEEPLLRLDDLFDEAIRRAEARRAATEKPVPVPWPDFAAQLGGGLWPGLHVLVGGTGTGKSSLALQIAMFCATHGIPAGYIGLELGELDIALRVIGEHANVPWSRLYTGQAEPREIDRATRAKEELKKRRLPFYVELGRPNGWPVSELEVFAARMRSAHPETVKGSLPMFLALDFLQIVGDELRADGRMMGLELRERIGRAAYFARDIARRLNVAVFCVSSAARANYDALADITTSKAKIGLLKGRRVVLNPDALVGMGKESGELEYSADSVTVGVRGPWLSTADGAERPIILVTAKGRATGASWCALRFEKGQRFTDWPLATDEVIAAVERSRPAEPAHDETPTDDESSNRDLA